MKYILLVLALIVSGCSSVVMKKGYCQVIPGRDSEMVCDDDTVVKDCQYVPQHQKSVCKKK